MDDAIRLDRLASKLEGWAQWLGWLSIALGVALVIGGIVTVNLIAPVVGVVVVLIAFPQMRAIELFAQYASVKASEVLANTLK